MYLTHKGGRWCVESFTFVGQKVSNKRRRFLKERKAKTLIISVFYFVSTCYLYNLHFSHYSTRVTVKLDSFPVSGSLSRQAVKFLIVFSPR